MGEPERRRRRPAVSCALCRKRKLRCNRENPCNNCMKSKTPNCVYENHGQLGQPSQPPRQPLGHGKISVFYLDPKPRDPPSSEPIINEASTVQSHSSSSLGASSTDPSTPWSQLGSLTQHENTPSSRVTQSNQQLYKDTPTSVQLSSASASKADIEVTTSLGGTFHFHHESSLSGRAHPDITRSVTHKTRLFGQSHWLNIVHMFKDMFEMNELQLMEQTSQVFKTLQKCKSLARVIKSQRAPPWPTPPTRDLPQKDVCDKLIDCYLQTSEAIYRVLHLPSFNRDYEELWTPGSRPDMAFLVQLKLVFAIGSVAYDGEFSLRSSAIRWVYEAITWISEPEFKSRLGIQYLQISILLLLARECVGVSGDSIWVTTGDLIRKAISMGLHRDPSHLPKRTTFASEIHRRLWNTILEVALKTSSISGGPPLISLQDFDTEPPDHFDDEQLMTEDPVPRPEDEFTQISIAIALRRTFPERLAATKFLNDLSSHGTYEETLRLDSELRSSYRALCRTLQGFKSNVGRSAPSALELRIVDFIMHRYISSLHIRFFIPALHETEYAFSRKLVVETALKMWCAVYPSSSVMAAQRHGSINPESSSNQDNLLERSACCGPGFYRVAAVQASLLIGAELDTQLREEQGLGPLLLRGDLLSAVNEAKDWLLHCIKIGETNIKGYLFICVIAAHIEGLMQGLGEQDMPAFLIKSAGESVETCLPILEKRAGQDHGQSQAVDEIGVDTQPDETPDWDFMMSDALFAYNLGTAEPISWMFNDGAQQATSTTNW